MSWKKLLLIAAIAGAFTVASAPKSEAHTSFSFGVGLGFPVAYYGYPGYYPYAYPAYYPYGYGYPAYSISYYYGRPFYWFHGRRVFIARRWR